MAQSTYTPIQLYRSGTGAAVPVAGNLALGELALNYNDEKLYFKNASGVVKQIAGSGVLGTVTSVAASGGTTGLSFSGSPITSSGTLTLDGTLAVANGGTGTVSFAANYILKGNGTSAVGIGLLYDDGTNVSIGTTAAQGKFEVRTATGGGVTAALVISNYVNASVNTGVALYFDPNGAGSLARAASIQSVQAISGSYADLRFFTANSDTPTERLRIGVTGAITSSDLADAVGYKGIPQNQQTSAYQFVLSDMGKHIFATASSFALTVPANSTTAFPVGAAITIVVGDATKTVVPAGGVTLYLAGTTTTGTRTLAVGAVATLLKVQTDVWFISGAGVS